MVYQYTQDGLIIEVVSLERMEQRIQQKKDQNVKKVSTWCVKTGITEKDYSHPENVTLKRHETKGRVDTHIQRILRLEGSRRGRK